MTPTPERALELAKELTSSSVILGCLPESTSHYGGVYVIDDVERDRIVEALDAAAAILNHYAEIAPKYQAVLDAEPVAYLKLNDDGSVIAGIKVRMAGYQDGFQPAILKPTP